jgi:hypothetical protein
MAKLLKLVLKLGIIGNENMTEEEYPKSIEITKVLFMLKELLYQILNQLSGPDCQRITWAKKEIFIEISILVCSILNFLMMYEVNVKSVIILSEIKKDYDKSDESDKREYQAAFGKSDDVFTKIVASGTEKKSNRRQKFIDQCDQIFDSVRKQHYYWQFNTDNTDKSMLYILMSLTMLGDRRLTKWSIQLLNLIHSQSINLKDTFLGMQLIDSAYEEEHLKIAKFAKHLQKLAETSENWYIEKGELGKQEQQEIKFILKELNRFLEVPIVGEAQSTQYIEEPEGEESNPGTRNTVKAEDRLDFIYTDAIKKITLKPSKFHQNIYRNTGILKSLVSLLKYDLQVIDSNKMDKTKQLDLVSNIYQILAWSCLDNIANQDYFMKYIQNPFLKHFESQRMAGSPLFIGNFVKRNKNIVLMDKVFHNFVCSILKECDNTSRRDILKPYILHSVLDLLQAADFRMRVNQNYVISRLFEGSTYKDLSVAINVDY